MDERRKAWASASPARHIISIVNAVLGIGLVVFLARKGVFDHIGEPWSLLMSGAATVWLWWLAWGRKRR